MGPIEFEALCARSRDLHGHRYVLTVASWIQQSGQEVFGVSEVLVGLEWQADRTRVIEALARLTAFGALIELPRPAPRNAPRFFQRQAHPYWDLVEVYTTEAQTRSSD